jgi:uncharacterized protein YdaU (DUF1376 family)
VEIEEKLMQNSGVEPVVSATDLNHSAADGDGNDMATPIGKRTTSPAFQWYPKDYLSSSKVQRMSMTERGIYQTLLSQCWLDNGLPTDLAQLAQMVTMKEAQFTRIWTNGPLHQCFHERGGRLHNNRLDEERRKQADYRRRQSDNGRRGGRPNKPLETQTKAVGFSGLSQPEPKKSSSSPISDLQSPIAKKETDLQPMDLWARELVNLYSPQGRCGWNLVERPLYAVLTADPAVPVADAWEALKARLEQQKRSAQWRAGKISRLDRWLANGLHLQELPEHDPAPEATGGKALPAWVQRAQALKAAQS